MQKYKIILRIKQKLTDVFFRHPRQLAREHILEPYQPQHRLLGNRSRQTIRQYVKFDDFPLLLQLRRFVSSWFGKEGLKQFLLIPHILSDTRQLTSGPVT